MWWKLYFDRQSLLKKHEDCLTIVLPQCKRISLNPRATLIWVRNFFKIIDPKTYKLPTKWQNGLTKISVSACNFTKKFFSQYKFTYSKVNNRSTRTSCEICSKLSLKTTERRQWHRSGVFIVNFKHISNLVLVFLLLTSNN